MPEPIRVTMLYAGQRRHVSALWRCHAVYPGAKRTRMLHYDPTHYDATLDMADAQFRTICASCSLAFDGEEITL